MASLILSKMTITYAVAHIMWWTSPGLLREIHTTSDECARPGNKATKNHGGSLYLQAEKKNCKIAQVLEPLMLKCLMLKCLKVSLITKGQQTTWVGIFQESLLQGMYLNISEYDPLPPGIFIQLHVSSSMISATCMLDKISATCMLDKISATCMYVGRGHRGPEPLY